MRKDKTSKGKRATFKSFEDVEHMAQFIMLEAKASLANAIRIMSKLVLVAALGFMFVGNYFATRYFVPIGIVFLAIAAGWLDAIGNECSCQRFFPNQTLNFLGKRLFRWQWIVLWTCTILALSYLPTCVPPNLAHLLHLSLPERLWMVCKMAAIPLALMLVCRALEPFRFRRARAEVKHAEVLLRQLAATRTASDIGALAPFIEPEYVPLYKLGSVAKILHDFVASCDTTDKIKIDLSDGHGSANKMTSRECLAVIYAPFRAIANNLLLWESRDLALYIVVASYIGLACLGYEYFAWSPIAILVPFVGPKSRAGRYARALQENIRLAQGASVEKKGGLVPTWIPQDRWRLNLPMLVYIGSTHITALYGLFVLVAFGGVCPLFGDGRGVKTETMVMAVVLYLVSALGITAGAHRLWSHRSYKASAPLRALLMIFNSVANQGTIFHWARDHRVHHLYSDTAADPHDSTRGFWFSHVGWLLVKKNAAVIEAGKKINLSDLYSDPIVMFQKRADPFWNLMWCFAFPAFLALMWNDSLWNGFLVGGVLRYVAILNATWAVNSVVHAWGSKPYNPAHLTTENGWVSLFALGEGWHNWHHAFSWDYATAELGALSQFNPTKVFIDFMALLGLAWDRKRASAVWAQRKSRWESEQGRPVIESLEGPPLFKYRIVTFGPTPYDDVDEVHNEGAADTSSTEH